MTKVRSYRGLRVYRRAFAAAMDVFHTSRTFPREERWSLTQQIRRSSRSVCANISEAWRRRMYPRAFAACLIDAEAEAAETRVHLEFAVACEYLAPGEAGRLDRIYDTLLGELTRMRMNPEAWVPSPPRPSPPGPATTPAAPPAKQPSRAPLSSPARNRASPPALQPSREVLSGPAANRAAPPATQPSRERLSTPERSSHRPPPRPPSPPTP